jgi:hypothetical protein
MNTLTKMLVALTTAIQPLCAVAATPIGPDEFEQIWLLSNQRNLIARYHQRAEQFRQDERPLFRLDIDAAPNQSILTSDGPMDAILDRIGLHYQSPKYLFLVDWLSLIPQPQTTEGYTYGDAVLGRSWLFENKVRLTLGIRMQTSPNTVQSGGQTVFNVTDNASHDTLGGFAHFNYGNWDLGTYYSRRDSNQANSLKYSFAEADTRDLYGTITNLRGFPERNIASRNELALNLRELISQHEVRANLTVASASGDAQVRLSNAYISYLSPEFRGFRFSGGVYHTYLIDSKESLAGAKLGMEYRFVMEGDMTVGAYVRKNAFGDIDAMVLKDKPVYSFTMAARY